VDFDPGPGVFNIASAGFGDFFILKLSITTDLTEISESFGNYIYPNPNNGLFSFAIKKEKINSIDIYNEAGQIVYSRKINSDLIKVDLREQPAGLYFYKFSDHFQSVKSGKFLIQY
jgi:hypothetical protein